MKSSAKKIELASVDDLFSTEEGRQDAKLEKIQEIRLSELHPFKNHPFKVKDDEAMMETADSIKQYGVLVPAIARPDPEGGYELVLGRGAAAVFLHRIVHSIFSGNLLKFLDGGVCDLDIGDPLILTDELLDGLFAVGCHRSVTTSLLLQLLFLAVGKVLGDGGLKQPASELCSADNQR